jgi:2-methylisocitrate lyase-like PEP mutase family enzyme
MTTQEPVLMTSLADRLNAPELLIAPGVYDAFTAALATEAGFEALYVSGASLAYTRLGSPDIGLFGLEEMATVVQQLADRVDTPLIVDADTGFGNAINVQRTVRVLESRGAHMIQIEDQAMPKRCGHLRGKMLVSPKEMAGKIRAAVDARRGNTLIMARTDAIAVEGFESALERAELCLEAGADVLFIEAPENREQMAALTSRFAGRAPLLANMVEGGRTPVLPEAELTALGYSVAIYPGGTIRAAAHQLTQYFADLKARGDTLAFADRMLDFSELQTVLGTERILQAGAQYDPEAQ